MSWKTWTVVAVIIIAGFAIYLFAAPQQQMQVTLTRTQDPVAVVVESDATTSTSTTVRSPARVLAARTPGVEPIHMEWLDAQPDTNGIDRNLFEFPGGRTVKPREQRRPVEFAGRRNIFAYPAPPPPPPPPPPPTPPDRDKDGIPDFRDNCPNKYNPDQQDIDHNGIGTACEAEGHIETPPPPPPPPKPVPPQFTYKYIGTFGNPSNPIATFNGNGEIINARVGDVIEGKFILRNIGIESVEIAFVGFPADQTQRIPLGQ